MDRLSDVEVFVQVVERASFSAAADALGISRSHASRMVANLEERLGLRLLFRTTRKVQTTSSGRLFYERCAPMIAGISAAEQEVRDEGHSPAGTLRISLPAAFGLRFLAAPMAEFARLHPQLRTIVHYDDRKVDVVGEGYDLSIRGGTVTEDDMVARKLWSFQTLLVAAPSYLSQLPAPQLPSELEAHPAVLDEGSSAPGIWTFQRGKERESVVMRSVFMANAASAVHAACIAGIGVAVQPEWMVNEDIAAGRLVHLLPDWELPHFAFWMLRPDRKGVPARVRAFQDFLLERLPTAPWSRPTRPATPASEQSNDPANPDSRPDPAPEESLSAAE